MPNWCSNSVEIKHDDVSKITAIESFLIETDATDAKEDDATPGLLGFLIPNPSGDWNYDWSVTNWGTKWDIIVYEWDRLDENTIYISFDSAWSPPIAAYETLVEQDYDIKANYLEQSMGFVGLYENNDDQIYEFDYEDLSSLDNIPEDIVKTWGLREMIQEELEIDEALTDDQIESIDEEREDLLK